MRFKGALVDPAQMLKFGLIGILNTTWSYLLYATFLWFGLGYMLASFFTIVLSVAFAFISQGVLVFGDSSRESLMRFILVWCCIYAVYLAVVAGVARLGVNHYLGGLIATPLVAVLSYILQRHFVFRVSSGN